MKVAIYCRVSTKEQNVKQQVKKCKEYAKRNGWEILKVIKDEESGRKELLERKEFKKLLDTLDRYDAVLVYNIDRLTRNWGDQAKLEEYFKEGCQLLSMSEPIDLQTASGRLMFRMKMAVSCYMPEDMREKQRIGIERAKKEGKYKGGVKGRSWA